MSDETTTPETEPVADDSDSTSADESNDIFDEAVSEATERPFTSAPPRVRRFDSIWNTPLGLAATVFLALKAMDLVHTMIVEDRKAREREARKK